MLDEAREVLSVPGRHVGLRGFFAQRLETQRVEQQARGDKAVRRILFDQRARGEHAALANFLHRHALVQVLERRLENALGVDIGQALARGLDQLGEPPEIERPLDAVVDDIDRCAIALGVLLLLQRALLRSLFAVEHVRARDFMLATAHQRKFDLVLDLLDVDRTTLGFAPHQRGDYRVGETRGKLTHARRRSALAAVDGKERLGDGDRDLRGLETDHGAIAADHLVLREAGIGVRRQGRSRLARHHVLRCCRGRNGGGAVKLHGLLS